jgi:hypothetical protein
MEWVMSEVSSMKTNHWSWCLEVLQELAVVPLEVSGIEPVQEGVQP